MIENQIIRAIMPSIRSVVSTDGANVAILTDWAVPSTICKCVSIAVSALGGVPNIISFRPLGVYGHEPPELIIETVLKHDAVIAVTSTALTHTNLIREAIGKGMRYLGMAGLNVDMFLAGACLADYERLYKVTKHLSRLVQSATEIQVTSATGTNVKFNKFNRPAFCLAGKWTFEDPVAAFPDGEVACSPVEGSTNGIIIVDGSMHGIGFCKHPIALTVKDGYVTDVSGGPEAAQLRQLIEQNGDEFSWNIAEFAIGTNDHARIAGSLQEDKKALGTVHFAIGDNHTLGGYIASKTHLDGVILNASTWLDGVQILNEGVVCGGWHSGSNK